MLATNPAIALRLDSDSPQFLWLSPALGRFGFRRRAACLHTRCRAILLKTHQHTLATKQLVFGGCGHTFIKTGVQRQRHGPLLRQFPHRTTIQSMRWQFADVICCPAKPTIAYFHGAFRGRDDRLATLQALQAGQNATQNHKQEAQPREHCTRLRTWHQLGISPMQRKTISPAQFLKRGVREPGE